ncbi:MAG: twin-arginine translocase TatA/TatE family subunit [SAR202 cluster bacterium]|nr:twin-arginine translocase TatA/TatE family subunit [SAR202 cluster bacterium]MDP6301497.1 twin-arginine translocase TatA/TatE family subunit [SAR202 cluster bacterium]MDP7102980.1 twin-arginine translocase TatA/TatE family subunit [SAR202 cluster bacterium]MDP7225410.1 twin-arginine translocase TatA/TatE family subunit [SAR202 cluster bacterium]MDP7414407.1 twin-arginine translocase TatA/TatE family subunit [SAR202 cluster bacterium]
MRNFGVTELIIILVIVMIIFGVGRLTEIGGALGKSIREFRKSSEGVEESVSASDSDSDSKQQLGQGNS